MGRLRASAFAVAAACFVLLVGGATGSGARVRAVVFTGYGFDTCKAPSVAALTAWAASPYRALGIYIGGGNRACPDGNLNAGWVATVEQLGWNLLPLYVGLQAPCVSQKNLAHLSTDPATAQGQGSAAADDAIARAGVFGLPAGSPIYFDMEGYSTKDAACTAAVQSFLAGWNGELRARGFVAGVYGSAASTIRDMAPLGSAGPDDAWIANWNGNPSVFGDPYVGDELWPNHQRIHQYKGGHNETFGDVTLNVDNDFVDAAAVGQVAPVPPPPPPTTEAGSVSSGDGKATASWTSGTFTAAVVVTLTPVTPPPNGYALQLTVVDSSSSVPYASFAVPMTIHILPQGLGLQPAASSDGKTWTPLPALASAALPAGTSAGYLRQADGSVDILTVAPGFFALLPDTTPPTRPAVSGRFVAGALRLSWRAAADGGSGVAGYQVLREGSVVLSAAASAQQASVRGFHAGGQTVYRVRALDGAGNVGPPSRPIVVVPTARPQRLPRPLPRWAWALFTWQHAHSGRRPAAAPHSVPAWYWRWAAWRAQPFRLARR